MPIFVHDVNSGRHITDLNLSNLKGCFSTQNSKTQMAPFVVFVVERGPFSWRSEVFLV